MAEFFEVVDELSEFCAPGEDAELGKNICKKKNYCNGRRKDLLGHIACNGRIARLARL
jgi:hypothetical protein